MAIHPHFLDRRAGVLLHLTSLPDGGRSLKTAFQFIDWLADAGFSWWQMLPVGPPGPCMSPYSSPSAFAGDTSFFSDADLDGSFQKFYQTEEYWLQDWVQWALQTGWGNDPFELPQAQFRFQLAWQELQTYAANKGIKLLGDIPIFVERGSADVAMHAELFRLNADGTPEVVTGVPPDCFSDTGQLWGHPHYNWHAHRTQNYEWWLQRFQRQLRLFDAVRIDHFIGFHNAWQVAGDAETAMDGHWEPAPGREILTALQQSFADGLPLLAEDLGVVTPPVHALRDDFDLPGMRILQNAFYDDDSSNLPQNCPPNSVTYTGTHDNQTIAAWLDELRAAANGEPNVAAKDGQTEAAAVRAAQTLARLQPQLNSAGSMTELAWTSGSNLVIVPMQDILNLGADARMNTPATTEGNWQWRMAGDALTSGLAAKLRVQLHHTDRLN